MNSKKLELYFLEVFTDYRTLASNLTIGYIPFLNT